MFFDSINASYQLVDVLKLTREIGIGRRNEKSRPFSAISFRLSGSTVFKYGSNMSLKAGPGSITFVPAGLGYSTDDIDTQNIIAIHVKTDIALSDKIETVSASGGIPYRSLFLDAYRERKEQKIGYAHRIMSIMYSILGHLAAENDSHLSDLNYLRIKNGINYMHSHYCEPSLTVETLADKCGISNEYFRRLYKSVYNSLPLCDLNSLRINRACALLRSGYYNTGTVAEECGFTSAKYFRTVFKHYIGMSPTEYMNAFSASNGTV